MVQPGLEIATLWFPVPIGLSYWAGDVFQVAKQFHDLRHQGIRPVVILCCGQGLHGYQNDGGAKWRFISVCLLVAAAHCIFKYF